MSAIIKPFEMTKGDIDDYLVTIKDSDGNLEDLTGASIVATMQLDGGSTTLINRRAATIANQTTNTGEFSFRIGAEAADTATPGTYNIEFEVSLSGKKITYPKPDQGKAQVIIADSLD